MTARLLYLWQQPTAPDLFERHYREVHIPLARKMSGLRSYAITDDVTGLRGESCFRVADLRWDTMDDLRAAFASPEGSACAQDVDELLRYTSARAVILGDFEELL